MLVQGAYQPGGLVFPGSFNPVHEGHRRMAEIASARFGRNVQPEISLVNVDKPEIKQADLDLRMQSLVLLGDPLVTRAPLFVDKAECFPGCRFVIGADTALRLSDVRYSGGQAEQRDAGLRRLGALGCRFLVFGRVVEGVFQDASRLRLEGLLSELCDFVPETEFRVDISSRELRAQE
ncbi:MAG: hypothetical protein AAF989_16880 [Planctomycetota bacterium]